MKYYSERLNKVFDTEKECVVAEQEYAAEQKAKKEREAAKKQERATAAAKVEEARKAMVEAQNAYRKELESFCKQFGTYHYSTDSFDGIPHLFTTLLDIL